MSQYYCPFCSSSYQFHKTRVDGLLVCSQCGDDLIKVPFINMTRVMGLIVASTFVLPLLLMIVFLLNEMNNQRIINTSEQLTSLSFYLDDGK